MPKMTIKGADSRLDGEYEVTMPPWTKREWYLVKKQCDVIASDFSANDDGTVNLDMNLLTAIGIVALHRAERDTLIPLFWETDDSQVDYDFSDLEEQQRQEAEADPLATSSAPTSKPESSAPSGNGSAPDGENSADHQSPTGSPSSAVSSASDRATSET